MKSQRSTPERKILERADNAAQTWRDAADRADIRNEPVLAAYFRNQAWRIATGKEWLADVTVKEPQVRPETHSPTQG